MAIVDLLAAVESRTSWTKSMRLHLPADLPANLPARGISSTDFVGRPPCRAHGGVGSGAGSWDLPQARPSHVWDESAAWDGTREVGIIRQRHCRSSVDVLDRGISRRTH